MSVYFKQDLFYEKPPHSNNNGKLSHISQELNCHILSWTSIKQNLKRLTTISHYFIDVIMWDFGRNLIYTVTTDPCIKKYIEIFKNVWFCNLLFSLNFENWPITKNNQQIRLTYK